MGHRKLKYRLPSSRNGTGTFAYWLLVLALAAIGIVVWRDSLRRSLPPAPKSKQVVAAHPAAPPPRASAPAPAPASALPPTPPPVESESPSPSASPWPRAVENTFETQLALVQRGISPGSLDGAIGAQTRAALGAFQQREQLPVTGQLDAATRSRLLLTNTPYTIYTVTSNDLARLQPVAPTWLGKSRQTALDYENLLELIAEKCFSHPDLIRRLNPEIKWTNVAAGTVLQVPDAAYPPPRSSAAFVVIHLGARNLEAFDVHTNLLVHFPCSIARLVEKRPVGELHVSVIAPNPTYTFDPAVFPESAEARALNQKLIIPAGPNNPVGVAWIGLDRPGYGIHGTPSPEQVGRTESHGCFRLANWNAAYLLRLVSIGTPVYVEE